MRLASTVIAIPVLLYGIVAIAADSREDTTLRGQFAEGYNLAAPVLKAVHDHQLEHGNLPDSKQMAGLPNPEKISGGYVSRIDIESGGLITVVYGNRIDDHL